MAQDSREAKLRSVLSDFPAERRRRNLRSLVRWLSSASEAHRERARRLLLNRAWLEAKVEEFGVASVLEDLELRADSSDVRIVLEAVRLSAHRLEVEPERLWEELFGRLAGRSEEGLRGLLANPPKRPWLRPLSDVLAGPGAALERTLDERSDPIDDLCGLGAERVATANEDGLIRVWNLTEGRVERVLTGHRDEVHRVGYLERRDLVVSAAADGEIRLWDWRAGKSTIIWTPSPAAIRELAVNREETLVAALAADGSTWLWELDSGSRHRLEIEGAESTCVCIDDPWVFTGTKDGRLLRWSATGHCDGRCRARVEPIRCIGTTAFDGLVVAGSGEGYVQAWHPPEPEPVACLQLHSDSVTSLLTAVDGNLVITGDSDGEIRVWDPGTGTLVSELNGHYGPVAAMDWLEEDQILATAGWDRSVRIWDLDTASCVEILRAHSDELTAVCALGADRVVSAGWDSTVRVWNLQRAERRGADETPRHHDEVAAVAVTEDGSLAVSASNDGTLRVWDVRKARCAVVMEGHENWITDVALSSDETQVASACDDHEIRVWSLSDGECLHVLRGHEDEVVAVEFLGGRIASASRDGSIRLWSAATGECRMVLAGHEADIWGLAPSRAGGFLASASQDRTVRLWDLENGSCQRVLRGHGAMVGTVAVSPNGRWVVSGCSRGEVRVWCGSTGECRQSWRDGDAEVLQVVVGPDNRTVFSALDDRSIVIRDLVSGERTGQLLGFGDFIEEILLTRNGAWLVAVSSDGSLRVWDWPSPRCIATFWADCGLGAVGASLDGRWFAAGDASGAVHLLTLEGG